MLDLDNWIGIKLMRFQHGHKKQKDSLKSWEEPAVLITYVGSQALREPIPLRHSSKSK